MQSNKQKSLVSLKKAKTSLEKIITMIEQDEVCTDIIHQNLSVIGLVQSSNLSLLTAFIENCENTQNQKQEILHIFKLLQK
ncbi:hypothetical protein CSB09_02610 [Candidatus Gracilibacteria bacterium]|nr:MAG: hypothetical protein CSB09_02610 [Candidatus Gracilibacteria bacterium]